MSSSTEDLRVELGYLRDNVVEAALQHKSSIVESGLDVYEALVETFIDVLREFGSPYSRQQALSEIHNIGGGWSEIEWVRDDYREIADAAIGSKNLSVLLPVLYFPVHLSGLAYRKRDYYIFAQFLNWLPYLYTEAVEQFAIPPGSSTNDGSRGRPSLLEIVRDRLSRYPQELAEYQIGSDIDDSTDAATIRASCEFARGAFGVFNRLLKSAYDERRPTDFQRFASQFQDVYRHEIEETSYPRLGLEPEVGDGSVDPPEAARHACYQTLSRLRQIIFLGLEAWLLRDYTTGKLEFSDAESFRGSLFLPSAIPEVWRLYLEARGRRYENELEWSWWESREHEGSGAYAGIDFGLLLLRPVLLRMLGSASSMSAEQIEAQPLELTPDLDYLVGTGAGPLIETLNDVADSAELRELTGFSPDAAGSLRRRFMSLARQQADEERIRVIETPLSPTRVEELKTNIVTGWHEAGYLRRIIKTRGNYELTDEPAPEGSSLSVHLWERKEIFVEGSRFTTHTWGTDWGRSLARGEDELVISQIAAAAPAISTEPVQPQAAAGYLDRALRLDSAIGRPVIFMAGSFTARWALAESGRLRYGTPHAPNPTSDEIPASSYFDDIPIYETYSNSGSLAVITDLAEVGIWRQYRPKPTALSEYLDNVILFELEPYTPSTALKVIEAQPEAFRYDEQSVGGRRERSLEERVALVLQSVRLLILEQLRFEVTNQDAARVIRFSE